MRWCRVGLHANLHNRSAHDYSAQQACRPQHTMACKSTIMAGFLLQVRQTRHRHCQRGEAAQRPAELHNVTLNSYARAHNRPERTSCLRQG